MSSNSQSPRLERIAAGLRHAGHGPRRIPPDLDADPAHSGLAPQSLADVVEDEVGCGTAHRSECEVDIDHTVALLDGVDNAEVDEVHGHLGILDLRERGPQPLIHESCGTCGTLPGASRPSRCYEDPSLASARARHPTCWDA